MIELSSFDYAIISDNKFIGAYIQKAKLLELKGQFVDAIENYKIVLKINEPSAFIYSKIGECYINLNNKYIFIVYLIEAGTFNKI